MTRDFEKNFTKSKNKNILLYYFKIFFFNNFKETEETFEEFKKNLLNFE